MSSQNNSILEGRFQRHVLTDTNQSFWQLSAIQLAPITSLPVLASSIILSGKASFINSIAVLTTSNLILWGIRYILIAMSSEGRKSIMDIAKDYFGKKGSYFIAILLLLTTMILFVEMTLLSSNALTSLFPFNEGPNVNPFMQISVLIGIISTVFCAWGMVALRKLSTLALPFILIALGTLLIISFSSFEFLPHQSFSLSMLPKILAINLAVTAEFPTFFRHSKSWNSSIRALTTIQIVGFLIGFAGLFLGAIINPVSGIPTFEIMSAGIFFKLAFIVLIAFSSICANVSNVYSASVGWEIFAPSALVGKREYLIIGFLLIIFYLAVVGLVPIEVLSNLTEDSLVNLSIVLVVGFLVSKLITRAQNRFDKSILFFSWFTLTVLDIFHYQGLFLSETSSLVISSIAIPLLIGFLYGLKFCIKLVKLNQ